MRHVARYIISFGMPGYLSDSHIGPYEWATRREMAEGIRDALELYGTPQRLFREVGLRRLWRHISRHGSSVAHFHLYHGSHVLSFHGLTEGEYREQSELD